MKSFKINSRGLKKIDFPKKILSEIDFIEEALWTKWLSGLSSKDYSKCFFIVLNA